MKGWAGDYCILEVITTGPDPLVARPVEAAAIRVRDGSEIDSCSQPIDPGVPVPESLLERTGRSQEEYTGGLSPQAALARMRDFCANRAVLAHEGTVLESPVLERFGAPTGGPILDTRELAWLTAPYLRDHSLAALAASILGETPSWRALEDARLLLHLLARLAEAWEETPRRVRGALLAALAETHSPWRSYLAGEPGRSAFPDLVDMIPRADQPARDEPRGRAGEGLVDVDEALSILAPGGPVAHAHPEYEARPQQAAMAEAVASTLNDAVFLGVEAGTGVGKSLAYLVPGVLHARGGGGPLVVSTYTRNLQEQLFHRDLPLLSRALGAFEFSLLKGRSNYLCLRKWADWCGLLARGEPVFHFGEFKPGESYAFLASWLTRTSTGDLEEIPLDLRLLLAELVSELASNPEECLRGHCRLQGSCWVEKARARAARSDVVVVNHALLLSQIGAGDAEPSNLILPDYRTLVVDEAHHLEDVATEAFSLSLSLDECIRITGDVSGRNGLVSRWDGLALDATGRDMLSRAGEAADRARSQAEELFLGFIAPLLPQAAAGRGDETERYRLDHRLMRLTAWERARDMGMELSLTLALLASCLGGLVDKALAAREREDGEAGMADIRRGEALAARAGEGAAALEVFMRDSGSPDFGRHLRWMERAPARGRSPMALSIGIKSAPVSVGEELSSLLFSRPRSAVLTSASLRVPGARDGFAFFLQRSGLDLVESGGREVRRLALDSPFDYSCQVRLIAVGDLPEPSAGGESFRRYMQGICEVIEEAVTATRGKALVLLTSHQQVDFLYSELRPRLESRGLCCLRQRRGMPNSLLLEKFREDRDSVLLATEAFWEGVDVPGESLSAVIMVKLPFRHPADPVVAGRMEYHDAQAGGGWGSYYMPLALTLFRQGIGRLVRRSTDQGIIVVLDPRFLTRSYARYFHAALPAGLRVERVGRDEVGTVIRGCFN